MIRAKKSLGQNFLIDKNIIKKIINLANINNQHVVEIGSGKGALTDQIIEKNPKSLLIIEKDNFLSDQLKIKYKNNNKIKVYNEDILKFDLEKKLVGNVIIFGNLPYNISSQILVKIINFKNNPIKYSSLIFMFQKEVAERIIGKYGSSKYGRLSILANYRLFVQNRFDVSPNCFMPKPKVNSTVLLLKPRNKASNNIRNIKNLEKITNIFFSEKRKMVNKNIKKILKKDEIINKIKDLNLNSRPSELKPEQFYKITELFEKI